MKRFSSIAGRILISALFMFLLFYSMLPAVNLRDRNFILYLIACILIFLTVNFLTAVKDFIQSLRAGRGLGATRDPVTGQIVFHRNEGESAHSSHGSGLCAWS